MAMKTVKRARVVHSPVENTYQVQYKYWMFGKWEADRDYKYHRESDTSTSFSTPTLRQSDALIAASARMTMLLERYVVSEESK